MPNQQKAPGKLESLKIAVLGGDEREQEIARLAAAAGASVTAFGFPWPEGGVAGVHLASSARDCLQGAEFCLMPIPGIAADGSIFAEEKIIPREDLLSAMAEGAHIILGKADEGLKDAAGRLGIGIHEYEHDQELMLLRAPAIVEAAIRIIIENTVITIHNSSVCVVGQGNIGSVLTRSLIALGARVTVAARNPAQRAMAYAAGAEGLPLERLAKAAPGFDMILSTVPAPIVTQTIIDALPATALVMDLSAPPGGVDLDHARRSGRKAVWARALGRRAPVTVGASQWRGVARIIDRLRGGHGR
ncbi:MAG: dipicolinate synthase subunit DpsA [Gammaproteobacteria bacterium]|nr:dipicolinate synthase subunit DpsA [Gammaproteobacteria bacterium]MXW46036.1 serine carboxypeptidase [Gammaproteobacteria bacterium]MYD02700.1 serine carboxypeptidase [Gammaproteobacteria bacterium]MYI25887.1 serine carboxypeptidase [Gammaproteobacteria bacterium]